MPPTPSSRGSSISIATGMKRAEMNSNARTGRSSDLRDDLLVRKHVMDQLDAPDAFLERVKHLYSHRDEKSRDELKCKNGKVFRSQRRSSRAQARNGSTRCPRRLPREGQASL